MVSVADGSPDDHLPWVVSGDGRFQVGSQPESTGFHPVIMKNFAIHRRFGFYLFV